MEQVKLYDTTLRDGMGGHGMSLSVGEKLKVVEALDALGVHFIEAGFPSSNPKEAEFFERLAGRRARELDDRRLRDDPAPRSRPPRTTRRWPSWSAPSRPSSAWSARAWRLARREGDPRLRGGEPGDDRRLVRLLRRRGQARGLRRRALLRRLPRRPAATRSNACGRRPRRASRTSPSATPTAAACPASSARRPRRSSRRSATRSRSASTPTTTPSARSPTRSPRSKPGPGSCRACVNGYGERCGNANLASILPALQLKMGFEVVSAEQLAEPDLDRPLPRRALQHGAGPRPGLRRPQRLRPQGGHARRRASPPTPAPSSTSTRRRSATTARSSPRSSRARRRSAARPSRPGLELDDEAAGAGGRAAEGARAPRLPLRGGAGLLRAAAAPRGGRLHAALRAGELPA